MIKLLVNNVGAICSNPFTEFLLFWNAKTLQLINDIFSCLFLLVMEADMSCVLFLQLSCPKANLLLQNEVFWIFIWWNVFFFIWNILQQSFIFPFVYCPVMVDAKVFKLIRRIFKFIYVFHKTSFDYSIWKHYLYWPDFTFFFIEACGFTSNLVIYNKFA